MAREPPDKTSPDLFSTDAIRDSSPPPPKPGAAKPTSETAPQRHILPKDLGNAVKHLSDGELDLLLAAMLEEIKRRGKMLPSLETDLRTLRHRFNVRSGLQAKQLASTEKISQRRRLNIVEVSLTRGQVNAIRSAYKAGITPARIARQFGVSQSNVRKALATDEPKK
jgi:predicted DNA-binding protein YlxM (UPF0122 family)